MTHGIHAIRSNSILFCLITLCWTSPASAEGRKTFLDPMISTQDRQRQFRLDHCVNSYRYPDRCSRPATQEAANRFCIFYGYRFAAQWQFIESAVQAVWIWTEEWNNGQMSSRHKLINGTGVFTGIECVQ